MKSCTCNTSLRVDIRFNLIKPVYVTGLIEPSGRKIGVYLVTGFRFTIRVRLEHMRAIAPMSNIHMFLSRHLLLNEFNNELIKLLKQGIH